MKLYSSLSALLVFFCGGTSLAGEISLYDQVSVERTIYQEISELNSSERIQKTSEYLKACHSLPVVLISEIGQLVGLVREKGPSYDCMKLGELSYLSWSLPCISSIALVVKLMHQSGAIPLDTGLILVSIVAGSSITWGYLDHQRKLQRKKVIQSSGSIYDIECGYRYSQLNLLKLLKQADEDDRMKTWRKEVLGVGKSKLKKRKTS